MLETLDHTIRIGSTPTFLYFDLYLYSAYAEHYVYFNWIKAPLHGENFIMQIVLQCCYSVKPWQFDATHHANYMYQKSLKFHIWPSYSWCWVESWLTSVIFKPRNHNLMLIFNLKLSIVSITIILSKMSKLLQRFTFLLNKESIRSMAFLLLLSWQFPFLSSSLLILLCDLLEKLYT